MKSSFPGHFANSSADVKEIWDNCLFVLDANVLLSLYRFSDATRIELLKVFRSLKERLWIPHQVAQEYLVNRLVVIGDQVKSYDDTVRKVEGLKKSLENINQAPFVSVETQQAAAKVFDMLNKEFAQNKEVHDRRIYSDDIKDELEILFEGRVGAAYSRDEMEDLIAKGKARYDEKIPPGFSDVKKGGESELFADRCKPYGDYIVWLQMITKAKSSGMPIIFVTGDVKEDWWLNFQGKTVGPLPALVQEFQEEADTRFYMYTPHKFLERANEHLEQVVSQVAVEEIKSSEQHDSFEVAIDAAKDFMIFPRRKKRFADLHPMDRLQNEREELIRSGVHIKMQHTGLLEKLADLNSYRDQFVPGLDDDRLESIDSQIDELKAHVNFLEAELEYTRIKIAECNRRLTEVRKVSSDSDNPE